MRHKDLTRIQTPILLPHIARMTAAAIDKLNRRSVSVNSRGLLRCSGKWTPRKIARARRFNLDRIARGLGR
jgi:hypothetical protein